MMPSLLSLFSSVAGALVGLVGVILGALLSRRTFFRQDYHVALRSSCAEIFSYYMKWASTSDSSFGSISPILSAIYATDLLCEPSGELHQRLTDLAHCLIKDPPDAYEATERLHLLWLCAQRELSKDYRGHLQRNRQHKRRHSDQQ